MEKQCFVCKSVFNIKPSKYESRRTCSYKCRSILYSQERRGNGNPSWNGGQKFSNGYLWLKCENHPHANAKGYVKRSRLVVEKSIGRMIDSSECVHHINGIKDDDRPENLQIVSVADHAKIHFSGKPQSIETKIKHSVSMKKVWELKKNAE
jgi:hypothetical protein